MKNWSFWHFRVLFHTLFLAETFHRMWTKWSQECLLKPSYFLQVTTCLTCLTTNTANIQFCLVWTVHLNSTCSQVPEIYIAGMTGDCYKATSQLLILPTRHLSGFQQTLPGFSAFTVLTELASNFHHYLFFLFEALLCSWTGANTTCNLPCYYQKQSSTFVTKFRDETSFHSSPSSNKEQRQILKEQRHILVWGASFHLIDIQ